MKDLMMNFVLKLHIKTGMNSSLKSQYFLSVGFSWNYSVQKATKSQKVTLSLSTWFVVSFLPYFFWYLKTIYFSRSCELIWILFKLFALEYAEIPSGGRTWVASSSRNPFKYFLYAFFKVEMNTDEKLCSYWGFTSICSELKQNMYSKQDKNTNSFFYAPANIKPSMLV